MRSVPTGCGVTRTRPAVPKGGGATRTRRAGPARWGAARTGIARRSLSALLLPALFLAARFLALPDGAGAERAAPTGALAVERAAPTGVLAPEPFTQVVVREAAAELVQDAVGPRDDPFVQVTFLDVGQADAVVVRAPEGQVALIDAGRSAPLRELAGLGVERIDLLVATHPHADHIGGMAGVLDALPVRFYMDNGQPHTTATYLRLLRKLGHSSVTYLAAEPRTVSLGSVRLDILPLPAAGTVDHNNRSVGIVLHFGGFSAFLSGDSEVEELTHLLRLQAVPDVTVLKAAHHGASNGFTWPFLEAARAEVVVISVGGNGYGHPRADALAAYEATAEGVYRTDRDGHVTVRGYEDGRYEILLAADLVAEGGGRGVAAGDAAAARGAAAAGSAGATGSAAAAGSADGAAGGAAAAANGPPADAAAAEDGAPATAFALTLHVVADAPGNDHRNTNAEYAVLASRAAAELDVGGWRLCDAARHCFRFPAGARVPAGGRVVVHTGHGRSGEGRFYMGSGSAVWNNDGDVATLYDATGAVVLRHVYE